MGLQRAKKTAEMFLSREKRMSNGYEWTVKQLRYNPKLTTSELKTLASDVGVKFYPLLSFKARKELGIVATRGRPKKTGALQLTSGGRGIEAKMAKTLPANTNAGFDDAIAVMKLAQSIGGYGVLYDVVDKFKKAGF